MERIIDNIHRILTEDLSNILQKGSSFLFFYLCLRSSVTYDLIDKTIEAIGLTKCTIVTILEGIHEYFSSVRAQPRGVYS